MVGSKPQRLKLRARPRATVPKARRSQATSSDFRQDQRRGNERQDRKRNWHQLMLSDKFGLTTLGLWPRHGSGTHWLSAAFIEKTIQDGQIHIKGVADFGAEVALERPQLVR